MSPFGIETLPAEALKALRTLPLIAERLGEVASHTRVLRSVDEHVTAIKDDTASLTEATRVLADMDRRIATIEQTMPELVEVQQHLARLPETMQSLDSGISGLTELLTKLVGSIETLDANVASLQVSMEPVGRLADKLPGGSKKP